MASEQQRPGANVVEDLQRRVANLERQARIMRKETPYMNLWDFSEQGIPIPSDGAMLVDYRGTPDVPGSAEWTAKFAFGGQWRKFIAPQYEIKIFADDNAMLTGDGAFIFVVPEDINNHILRSAEIYITTLSSSGLVTVSLYNLTDGYDMLATPVTIDVGEYHSYTAATRSAVSPTNGVVTTGDRISINVDVAGTGAKGLGVILVFS
jgi:hypothetical protein